MPEFSNHANHDDHPLFNSGRFSIDLICRNSGFTFMMDIFLLFDLRFKMQFSSILLFLTMFSTAFIVRVVKAIDCAEKGYNYGQWKYHNICIYI